MCVFKYILNCILNYDKVSKYQIHHVAMWTQALEGFACQTQKYAKIEVSMCFGMPFILLMLPILFWLINSFQLYSLLFLLLLLLHPLLPLPLNIPIYKIIGINTPMF